MTEAERRRNGRRIFGKWMRSTPATGPDGQTFRRQPPLGKWQNEAGAYTQVELWNVPAHQRLLRNSASVNPTWVLRTGRLTLTPVGGGDLADLRAIKASPSVFAVMLGGVRDAVQTAEDLAHDVVGWGRDGFGMWAVREGRHFVGITGLAHRADGQGIALRFAFWPEAQGRGLAREAAFAALRFGHDRALLPRVIAVARETNFGSRTVLGGIGMWEAGIFEQRGCRMILYESVQG